MYSIGTTVLHPGAGVCRIEDIRQEALLAKECKTYYILKPVYENAQTTIYCPVDSDKIALRSLLTAEDIHALLHNIPTEGSPWIANDLKRQEVFAEILREGDRVKLIRLILDLRQKQREKQQAGKKLHLADGKVLHEAEKRIGQEFAYVLHIQPDEVIPMITSTCQKDDNS
jgi:CarD family transcriptional regulator